MKHYRRRPLRDLHPRPLKVNLRLLRCAVDHAKILYRTHVSDQTFKRFSDKKKGRIHLPLPQEHEGKFQPLRVEVMGPRMILKSRQMRICVWAPESAPESTSRRNGVEVDLHGAAFNSSKTGLDVLGVLRSSVEELLFSDRWPSPTQRRRHLSPLTFPGRTDVATDIEIQGHKAHLFAEREVFFVDDENGREDHWFFRGGGAVLVRDRKSRSRDGLQREEVAGSSKGGRSLFRKSKRHDLAVYEKAKVQDADRKASDSLKDFWRRKGWTRSTNVLRCELRLMAEWFSVNAKGITFDEFLERLPELFRKVAKRDRHLAYAPGSTKRRTRRELSPLWKKLLKAFKKLGPKTESQ